MKLNALSDEESEKVKKIYELYATYIYRVSIKLIGNVEVAKDCTQISYERIIHYLYKIDDVESSRTESYIYMIVASVARDIIRNNRKYIFLDDKEIYRMLDSCSSKEDVCKMMIDSYQGQFIEEVMDLLEDDEKEILRMKYGEKKSYSEISNILGLSSVACRKRIQRIKEKLAAKRIEAESWRRGC